VQAGRRLHPHGVTELGDDRDLTRFDGEEAQQRDSQTEQAEADERADPTMAGRDSLLPDFPRSGECAPILAGGDG
jgi:hypothetical protein